MKKLIFCGLITLVLAAGCRKELPVLGVTEFEEPYLNGTPDYSIKPESEHAPEFLKARNEQNNNLVNLGRVLFYDKQLSINKSISCGSCHVQANGFAEPKAFSTGFGGLKTSKNSMALVNLERSQGFFWDLRQPSLLDLTMDPVQNHIEMGFDKPEDILQNLRSTKYYKALFVKAFGDSSEGNPITLDRSKMALQAFLSNLISYKSSWDFAVESNFVSYTPEERRGLELFRQKRCIHCHGQDLEQFAWGEVRADIGLDNQEDPMAGNFKIPSLRNVEVTAPYMHDGRFKTLEQVVEHYNSGIKPSKGLHWLLREGEFFNPMIDIPNGGIFIDSKPRIFPVEGTSKPIKMGLSDSDKKALVAFLKTLTDREFLSDPRFSNPFAKAR